MKTGLSAEQLGLQESLAEFFEEELVPVVRRMADRSPYAGIEENPEIRAMVGEALAGLGLLRLRLPPEHGGLGLGHEAPVAVAEQLGAVLYQGTWQDTVTAGELLVRAGAGRHDELLTALGAGEDGGITLAVRSGGAGTTLEPAPMTVDRAGGTVTARRDFVAFVPETARLLVLGRTEDGAVTGAVVRNDAPGLTVRRHEELGRGELYAVGLDGTPVQAWLELDGAIWPEVLDGARLRQAAYLVGLSQGALDLAVGYAKSRRQFGKPIGHQQALALRLAGLAARLDAVRLTVRAAAWEADHATGAGAVRLRAAQTLAMAADLARRTTGEVMQVHGAYGMTEDSDAQLFYRRAAVESIWLGSPAELRGEVVPLLKERLTARSGSRFA